MDKLRIEYQSLKSRHKRQLSINKLQSKQLERMHKKYQDLINYFRKNIQL